MAAPTNAAYVKKALANSEPSTHGTKRISQNFRSVIAIEGKADIERTSQHVRNGPCVDGSELARAFFTFAALVGAAMCSAFGCGSHDRWP